MSNEQKQKSKDYRKEYYYAEKKLNNEKQHDNYSIKVCSDDNYFLLIFMR